MVIAKLVRLFSKAKKGVPNRNIHALAGNQDRDRPVWEEFRWFLCPVTQQSVKWFFYLTRASKAALVEETERHFFC